MEKTFIRVRSIKDIVIFVALIVLGSVLVALPTGAAVNITGFFMLFAGLILALVLKTGLAAALINAVPFAQWNILVVMISGGLICWILSNFISNSAAANLIVPILAVVGTAFSMTLHPARHSLRSAASLVIRLAAF